MELRSSDVKNENLKDYTLEISTDGSTLPKDHFEIVSSPNGKLLSELENSSTVRVIIKKESEEFKQAKPLELILKILVKRKVLNNMVADEDSNNVGKPKEIRLTLLKAEEPIPTYNYLGYLGTNFDLVDGVQAKNLFFATNIFIPSDTKWGFSLGLYGNRTMTRTDSSKQATFQSRVERINSDSIARYYDTAMSVATRSSDNIGATFSPLIPLKPLNHGSLRMYYAPQFEFIWRRTTIKNQFVNQGRARIDSMPNRFPANTPFPLITPLSMESQFNVYDVYLGIAGLLLRYENDEISVRLSSSIGLNLNYTPVGALSNNPNTGTANPIYPTYHREKRIFFFGRLWITEPTTGLTLGAEVSNYFGNRKEKGVKIPKAQPYYNVTLSKAFDLKNLAGFVKPLTNR